MVKLSGAFNGLVVGSAVIAKVADGSNSIVSTVIDSPNNPRR
jgi:hypothetical protein